MTFALGWTGNAKYSVYQQLEWFHMRSLRSIRRPHRITHLEVLKRAKSITVTWKRRFSKPSFYSVQPTMVSIYAL